jgi:putative methionine-R-sulfoxide reductase with GAF domain
VLKHLKSNSVVGFSSIVVLVLIGIAIDLLTSGWPWWLVVLAFIVSLFLALYVYALEYYWPRLITSDRYRQRFIEMVLIDLLDDYLEQVPEVEEVDIRLNVMLPKSKWPWRSRLSIKYAIGAYSGQEWALEFRPGVGCAGTAWAEHSQVYFDLVKDHTTLKGMSDAQREATQHLHSILSTPIFRDADAGGSSAIEHPIGILNIDSPLGVDTTRFDQENVRKLAADSATLVGALL